MSLNNSELRNLVELLSARFDVLEKKLEKVYDMQLALSNGGVVNEDLLTVEDAMGFLNVCRQTLSNIRNRGEIACVEGKGSMVLFKRSELERYKSAVLQRRIAGKCKHKS